MVNQDSLPIDLVESDGFKESSKKLLSLPVEKLRALRENLPAFVDDLNDPNFIHSSSTRIGISERSYKELASFLKMLISTDEAKSDNIASLIVSQSGLALPPDVEATLASILLDTDSEREIQEGMNAFFFGNSYKESLFRPLIVPSTKQVGQIYLGGCLTISTLNVENSVSHFSFTLSQHELKSLRSSINRAIVILEKLEEQMGGGTQRSSS